MANPIDTLLERYLTVLDEYTQLRKELSTLQSQVYHNIARANFTGERGMRYGPDQYDERMCALRRVQIESDGSNHTYLVKNVTEDVQEEPVESKDEEAEEEDEKAPSDTDKAEHEKQDDAGAGAGAGASAPKEDEKKDKDEQEEQTKKKNNDPLRWFGILTPMALRDAQKQSIDAVERVIPRLVSVNAEMEALEIEVRRQRKRRAKAEAANKTEREARKEVKV